MHTQMGSEHSKRATNYNKKQTKTKREKIGVLKQTVINNNVGVD